jgi:hypothetical protein
MDLHGVKHQDVDRAVENFVLMNQWSIPLTIICGNSEKMISLVKQTLHRLHCECTMLRYGIIVVTQI